MANKDKPSTTLQSFREKHFRELDENIRVWKSIRDNEDSTDRDRGEAAKNIARALGSLTPDRATTKPDVVRAQEQTTPEEDAMIAKIVGGID